MWPKYNAKEKDNLLVLIKINLLAHKSAQSSTHPETDLQKNNKY